MAIFIALLLILTSYVIASDMESKSKTTFYIAVTVIVLLLVLTALT